MRGYPKFLATRADYEYVRENFPFAQWGKDWRKLLTGRYVWAETGPVPEGESGVIDATHRVAQGEGASLVQLERVEDANAPIFMRGFTVEEVEAALAEDA